MDASENAEPTEPDDDELIRRMPLVDQTVARSLGAKGVEDLAREARRRYHAAALSEALADTPPERFEAALPSGLLHWLRRRAASEPGQTPDGLLALAVRRLLLEAEYAGALLDPEGVSRFVPLDPPREVSRQPGG